MQYGGHFVWQLIRSVRRLRMDFRDTRSDLPNYAVILWDNDRVLVDTERWYFEATRELFAGMGIELTVEHYSEYFLSRSIGTSTFGSAHGLSEADIAALQDARNERYVQLLAQEEVTIEGVRETLAVLRPRFAMGIVTSSRRQHFETMHRRTGLLELFDFAITHEDYAHGKPAPDPYLVAIARSGSPPTRGLAIEDAPRGLIAARAAALDCWVIPTEITRQASFAGATRVLNRVADVAALLLDPNSAA
jgi:HAD superfamily hydrolase (TIGR01509 family)